MLLSKLDFFSQPFLFNLNNNQLKKGTIQGAIFSLGIQLTVLAYFIYLTMLYFQNKIDPIFRSQSFISNDLIEIPLREDLVVFRFQADLKQNLDQFEKQMNLTYIVPVAQMGYQNGSDYQMTTLNVIKCSSQSLSNYYCLDYSNFPYQNLMEITEKETTRSVNIPEFITKSRESIEQSQKIQLNTSCQNQQDEVLENEEEEKFPNSDKPQGQLRKTEYLENEKNTNNTNEIYLSNQDSLLNKGSIISESNEIKNSTDSFRNVQKQTSINQLSIFSNNQPKTQAQKLLNEETKISQLSKITQMDSQNGQIITKDIKIELKEQKTQQINLNQQDSQNQNNKLKQLLEQHGIVSTPKKNSSTIEYYIKKFKTIQDLNVFKKFTRINFGYRFTLQKLNCFKKEAPEQEQKKNYISDHYLKKEAGQQLRKETYFEKQLDIFDSTDLSCKYIKRFIQNCNRSKVLEEVDKRILSSINKNTNNNY
ncbi:hypothetical protein ABPG73_018921 [Tetrahymena malaccensis]